MLIYLGYLLLILIQLPFFRKVTDDGSVVYRWKPYLILCCAELTVLAGIRGYTVGADTGIYLKAFDHYSKLPLNAELVWPYSFELGYFWLTKLCGFLHFSKTAFLFLIAFIIYIPIFKSIYKYSKIPVISIFVYFAFGMFSYSLGIFRQMIAISIILLGLKYVKERCLWKYLFFVFLAMLFHTTALIVLPLYFIKNINPTVLAVLLIPTEIILIILGRYILNFIIVYILPKYSSYLSEIANIEGMTYLMLIFLNMIYFLALWLYTKYKTVDKLFLNALAIAIVLQVLGYSMEIFGRIVTYYSVFLIFLIPDMLKCVNQKHKLIFNTITVMMLFALIIKDLYGNAFITPYYTFWMQ